MQNDAYNRLIHEKSPYLLQHAENPVDWYPWGEEAFAAAKAQDKPIFLSIGYSTCHWCHVMAHESFEDSSVAALMNDAFINIKVDREERPDIDNIYMTVCQMMTQSGGWPLTIIMTPDKRPFYAATYIPKNRRFNRPGMMELIPIIKEAWQNDRDKIMTSAEQITAALNRVSGNTPGGVLEDTLLNTGFAQLAQNYDKNYGGFSEKPKFPTPHNLLFLLRYHQRTGDKISLQMVEHTLQQMRLGGIFDHVGFGFHRYATDEYWLLPHFEKMLYDQAMLTIAFAEAYQITGNSFYEKTAREIITYVLRDMTDAKGGFYSAEDADSEGEEGKFYVWTAQEIAEILGKTDAELFNRVYGIEPDGNFMEEATGHRTGANIPHQRQPLEKLAVGLNTTADSLAANLENMRQKLFAEREKRVHPLKDDKILTDWNGLMIAALSRAAQAFDAPEFAAAATNAADFMLENMRQKNGKFFHRYRNGDAAINGYLDDYAFAIWGFTELYQTTFDTRYLQAAIEFTEILESDFWDDENGGYFFTADAAEQLLVRKKEIYDGAVPSGNSVMMLNLQRLARLTGRTEFENHAEKIGRAFSDMIRQSPIAYTMLLCGLDFGTRQTSEIVVVGDRENADTQTMIHELHRRFLPNAVVLHRPANERNPEITKIAPFTAELSAIENKATAYVCRNFACELPTTDVEKMVSLIEKQ